MLFKKILRLLENLGLLWIEFAFNVKKKKFKGNVDKKQISLVLFLSGNDFSGSMKFICI
jgi:hypothetical protein